MIIAGVIISFNSKLVHRNPEKQSRSVNKLRINKNKICSAKK